MPHRSLLALALLLAAPLPAEAQNLSGPWRVVAMSGIASIPADAEAIFELEPERITGRAFCNRFSAAVEREGPELSVGRAATTRMACPSPLMQLESAFLDILGRTNSATVSADGVLTLRAPDGRSITARSR